ncbi:MAG: hypothetical protein AB1489_21555 [Acidobacteriota bacterium]
MPFTLRLLFSGLCVYVPNTEKPCLRVLLIDARAPGVASNGKNHVSHVPAVRFAIKDLAQAKGLGKKQADYYLHPDSKLDQPQGMWILNGDELEILINGNTIPEPTLGTTAISSDALSLLPDMRKIYPDTNGLEVKEECFDGDLDKDGIGIVARIRLKAGEIGIYNGHSYAPRDKFGKPVAFISQSEYKFISTDLRPIEYNTHQQRLASCCYYEINVEAENVELFSKNSRTSLMFTPNNGSLVEVMLENVPPVGLEMARPSDENVDIDFELIYSIAKTLPTHRLVPVKVKQDEAPRPELCWSAIFNASNKA